MKNRRGIVITIAFQKPLNEFGEKPNKISVDKSSEFRNRSIVSWLQNHYIEMYLIYDEEESVVAKRFIRTLKNRIYKYMTSISENVYIDKLADIVTEYNNFYHRISGMKPIGSNSSTCNGFSVENINKDLKFQVGDPVRISKYKQIYAKD